MRRRGCLRDREYICCLVWGGNVLIRYCHRAGGVIILNGTGKIDINNTFEERLKILEDDALPAMRTSLFGENENRRFKD